MNKRFIKIVLFAAIIAAAGWNISQSEKGEKLSDVALANVEALTGGETGQGTGQPEYGKWSFLMVDCIGANGYATGEKFKVCINGGYSDSCIGTSCN